MDAIAINSSVEMIRAICRQAVEDAELVAHIIDSIYSADKQPDRKPVALAREQLIGLAVAVRLAKWELNQIPLHLNADLPTSKSVLERVFTERPGKKLTAFVNELRTRMFDFYLQNFVWSGSDCDLAIDLVLTGSGIDELVKAVADLLVSQIQST